MSTAKPRVGAKRKATRAKVKTDAAELSVKALARLVKARTPKSISNALNDVVVPYLNNPIAELHPLARTLRVLFILDVDVDVYGIDRFFWCSVSSTQGGDEGVYAADAADFCDRIGAERAAAYLRAGIALFPDSRVPADFIERNDALESFNNEKTGYPLAKLDAEYKGATQEMLVALQRFVVENRDTVAAALRGEGEVAEGRAQLDAILGEKDDWRFLDRLLEWGRQLNGEPPFVPFAKLPPALRELSLVRLFVIDVQSEGCWKFLEHFESVAQLRELAATCERVGATRAAAYLCEMPKAFPGGRIPTDERKRSQIILAMDERPGGDPLAALDEKYAGAADELLEAWRRHLSEDPAAYEKRMAS